MHTLQPVVTGPNGEQLGIMQPPMSVPLMMPSYQMMVLPQAVSQTQMTAAGSPSLQHGSPAGQDSSRSGTPASQPTMVFSQGLTPEQQVEQAQLLQAMATAQLQQQQQQQQDNGSVAQSPAPQGSAGSQGSPAPPTPGSMGSPMPPVMGDGIQQVSGLPIQIAPGLPVNMLGFQPQPVEVVPETVKNEKIADMKPPKKPLTPYMRFSKSVSLVLCCVLRALHVFLVLDMAAGESRQSGDVCL
jgi:hypothetical protein